MPALANDFAALANDLFATLCVRCAVQMRALAHEQPISEEGSAAGDT